PRAPCATMPSRSMTVSKPIRGTTGRLGPVELPESHSGGSTPMSWSSRRAILVLTAAALLAGMSLLQVQAQKRMQKDVDLPVQPQPNQPKKEAYDLGRLTLPKEKLEDLKDLLDAAEDRVKEKEWKRACEILQKLVGRKEDVFVPRIRKDN